jgi:tetratricopeptide (TPR) repeat protein
MALGFGFNKAKVLAAAEKFVQQGKLQSAIAEYEKITKEDPKDLTVLNTIGDLYARVGENERAAHYFRKVGDQYAQNGFTPKAIAIHKKLTNLVPGNLEYVNKLAELYSQQGLFKDARQQYMQVADHLLKSGDNAQAARIFQRILELDPENTATQSKLAELYTKLGKKNEARNIYYTAAESLYVRGSYDSAEEALNKVLALSPEDPSALLLRGMIAADAGDSLAAVQFLNQVPDLDSRPEGLRALLRAKLQAGTLEGVEDLATKLLTAHNDLGGVSGLAQWYAANHHIGNAMKLYERHAEVFLATGRASFQETLYSLISPIKDNPDALAIMARLMQRCGDSSHSAEIMELQAHACAQRGDLKQARDFYLRLSELEPENALHSQNYKQMLSRLGEDPTTRPLNAEEASQAFMVEELDEGAAVVHQNYDPPTEKAIEAALTDAELFVSYNVPAKAIPPLEAALPLAPRDVTLNQRLAVLYARSERYADAARVCHVLSDIYREAGHGSDASRYLEAAKRYSLRAPASSPVLSVQAPAARAPEPPMMVSGYAPPAEVELPPEPPAPSVQEFSFDVPDHLLIEPEHAPSVAGHAEPAPPAPIPVADASVAEEPAAPPSVLAAPLHAQTETEASSEWESMLDVEHGEPSPNTIPEMEVLAPAAGPPRESVAQTATAPVDAAAEKIQEIEFYIAQEMWDAAKKAILDLTEIAPDAPEVTQFISKVSAGQSREAKPSVPTPVFELAPPAPAREPAEPPPPPVAIAQLAPRVAPPEPQIHWPEPPQLKPPKPQPEPMAPPAQEFALEVEDHLAPATPPAAEFSLGPAAHREQAATATAPVHVPEPGRSRQITPQPVDDSPLEDILPEFSKPAPAAPSPAKDKARKPPAGGEKSTEDILTDFVHQMEKTDLADFVPRQKPEAAPPAKAPAPAAAHSSPKVAGADKRVNGDMQDAESASVLSDILSELQEETEEASEPEEDAETHYNLGIAFKEMGLLDEAIGELQKVCHAMDRGNDFSQPIQAYTWLAQCLVDKGAPEAGVRWYNKALQLPGLDDGSRCAIYYDLALAYEAFGDKKSALANFMEVYGSNIDFRDVASRIKALKS